MPNTSYRIIDAHTHILDNTSLTHYNRFNSPDAIITINFYKGFANGKFDDKIPDFDKFVSSNSNVFSLFAFDLSLDISTQLSTILEKLSESKIKGIKIYTGYQHVYPFDEMLWPIYTFCAKHDLPVLYHCGALYEFPNSNTLLKYAQPIHVDEVANKFKETKFVIPHLGFPYTLETATLVSKNENVYTDMSGIIDNASCFEPFKNDLLKAITYYPNICNKIMFGTDFISPDDSLSEITLYKDVANSVFNDEIKNKVFFETANTLYNLNL